MRRDIPPRLRPAPGIRHARNLVLTFIGVWYVANATYVPQYAHMVPHR